MTVAGAASGPARALSLPAAGAGAHGSCKPGAGFVPSTLCPSSWAPSSTSHSPPPSAPAAAAATAVRVCAGRSKRAFPRAPHPSSSPSPAPPPSSPLTTRDSTPRKATTTHSHIITQCSANGTGRAAAAHVAVQEAGLNAGWREEVEQDVVVQSSKQGSKMTEEDGTPSSADAAAPSAFEVQSLLMQLCDESSIAELKIKVGTFKLHVKRASKGKAGGSHAHAFPYFLPPPVPSMPMAEALAAAGAVGPTSFADPVSQAASPAAVHVDEGLLYVSAPSVGILRRGRVLKGKRGNNLVEVGAAVKKGQVVCYIEQLGTQLAVESVHEGEVVGVLVEDGDAVGFGDQLISIRPSFPGIK